MTDYCNVKNSGTRQEFKSGAVRDIQRGKGRYDLINPVAEDRLAKHYENGAVEYGDNNYTLGIPLIRFLDSAKRHLSKYLLGDRSEDHIIACAWNCFALVYTEVMIQKGKLPANLAEGLPCYLSDDEMDQLTKDWWTKINNLIESKNNENILRS